MVKKLYVNEAEYHQLFINSVENLPAEMKSEPDEHVLVWAHELRLFDAGINRGDGYADILTVDESGYVWLIEAKLGDSAELNYHVWGQLCRYRKALMSMDWDKIHRYIKSFIRAKEKTIPQYGINFQYCNDLVEVIKNWQKTIGRSKLPPEKLRDKIANSLKTGSFGMAVLCDVNRKQTVQFGKNVKHTANLAYIQGIIENNNFGMLLRWIKRNSINDKNDNSSRTFDQTPFDEWENNIYKVKCSIDTMADGLCDELSDIWFNTVLPNLKKMGWDGRDAQNNRKSITVPFLIKNRWVPLLLVGWPGTDSKTMERNKKYFGSYGMKFNLFLYLLRNEPFMTKERVERWAKMMYDAGWRGKGSGKYAGVRLLTDSQFETWGKVMNYNPKPNQRDFSGKPGEKEAIGKFFVVLNRIIKEMNDCI